MQQNFPFINLFNSAQHVSGDKFAHQEHFLTVYTVQRTDIAADWCGTGRQQCRCVVPKAVYTVKKCS